MKLLNNDYKGLTQKEIQERIDQGKINYVKNETTKSYKEIFVYNICTFFNFINVVLLACVFFVGSYRNMLFILVVIFNTLAGIYQEIKAKLILDKISILHDQYVDVIRDDQLTSININDLVLDDYMILTSGKQIPSDSIVIDGQIEVNESLLTGESDAILKTKDDSLFSGSFITSGKALCQVIHVGKDNYVTQLIEEAKKSKAKDSQLNVSLNSILKIVSIILFPLAFLLFSKEYFIGHEMFEKAVVSTVAAVLGMIPSGLVLLTSIALTLSVVRLAKKQTLVQHLFCIETLARVDTICLDKTGTLTKGKMKVEKLISLDDDLDLEKMIQNVNAYLDNENVTAVALNEKFPAHEDYTCCYVIPFSSQRKYSAVSFEDLGTIYMGASQFLFKDTSSFKELLDTYTKKGYRLITIGYSPKTINDTILLDDIRCIGIVVLSDIIREEAKDTLKYFKDQDTHIKIISGDDPITVSSIARRVGLENYDQYVDATTLKDDQDIYEAVKKYTIFGRVTPEQKKAMVIQLQKQNHTVAMTGDGVNDILALKAADCSIAMASGSDAAKNSANIVLLDNNFDAMPHIVHEGRRVINNITASASMYLIKTIFSVLLTILLILIGHGYPFEPIHLTVISACCVAVPTFMLTYEPNFNRVEGDFMKTVFRNAFPFAFMIALLSTFIVNVGRIAGYDIKMLYTMCMLLTSWCYYCGLKHIYSPMTFYRGLVIYTMQFALYGTLLLGSDFLDLGNITYQSAIFLMFIVTFSKPFFALSFKLFDLIYKHITQGKLYEKYTSGHKKSK